MTPVDRLLEFAGAEHVLPAAVESDTLRLLADTLAVGAAGASAPGAEGVLTAARQWGEGRQARTIGDDHRLPCGSAAFVNGFRIHCLEWDAVHEPAVVHAMSVVVAAVGAVIDASDGPSDNEILSTIAVGVEIAAGLGDAATSPLAFFRPATAGCLGAALAAARILGAPVGPTLGLAYGFCSGTMQAHVEGSIGLPLQIANAARSAVTAAELAKQGLAGPRDVLDGPFGYFALFDSGDSQQLVADFGSRWRIQEVSVKPFPCGRASHALLTGIQQLALPAAQIDRIALFAPPLIERLVGRPMMKDMAPAYARLCGPFLAALMATDGRIDPRRFVPSSFADEGLRAIAERVTIETDGSGDPNALSPQLLLADTDRGRVEIQIPHTLGSAELPMSPAQSEAKRKLAEELALVDCDERVFRDPLGYFKKAA